MMQTMRTTVTLDPDVAAMVKRVMAERAIGFKEVVNEGLRVGLGGGRGRTDFVFPSFDMGMPFVDLTQANRVAEALEDEAIVHRMSEGR